MKKIFLALTAIMFFASAQAVFAQSKAATPAQNSPVRKAIVAVVKKKFGKTQKNIDKPDVLKVQGSWARIVYDVKSDGEEGSTGVNLILKKSGAAWKIVWDYSVGDGDDPEERFPGIPQGILMPWDD